MMKEDEQLLFYQSRLLLEITNGLQALLIKNSEYSANVTLREAASDFDEQIDQRWPLGEATWYGEES